MTDFNVGDTVVLKPWPGENVIDSESLREGEVPVGETSERGRGEVVSISDDSIISVVWERQKERKRLFKIEYEPVTFRPEHLVVVKKAIGTRELRCGKSSGQKEE